jgi:hypothetical protein
MPKITFTGTLVFDLTDDQFTKLQDFMYRKGTAQAEAIQLLFPVGITRERALYDLSLKNKKIRKGETATKRAYAPQEMPTQERGDIKRKAIAYGISEAKDKTPWMCKTRSASGLRCCKHDGHTDAHDF